MAEAGDRAVESVLARAALPLVCAMAMAMATLVGKRVIDGQEELTRAVYELKVDIAVLKNRLDTVSQRAGQQ